MSDRTILGLAIVPMVAGVLLVSILQRGEPLSSHAASSPSRPPGTLGSGEPSTVEWPGVVAAGRAAELASEYGGQITKVLVRSGQRVEEGQTVLRMNTEDANASVGIADAEVAQRRSDVARAVAKLQAARSRLERLEAGAKWLAAQEVDAARAEVQVAEAEVRASRALVSMGRAKRTQQRVRADRHTLTAPFAGRVVSIVVDEGDTVTPGRVLARIITEERQIKFALPRDDLARGLPSEVWVASAGSVEPAPARVIDVRPEVDAAAQLVFATAALPAGVATDAWLVGTKVRVSAPLSADADQKEKWVHVQPAAVSP